MTRIYASPEQRRGASLTTASDLYSAGLLLNELLTGHPSSLEHEEASIPRQLPKGDLGLIVKRALEADPADRYRSADHFADDLSRTLAHELPTGIETSTGHRAFLFLRRHRLALLLACAVLFAAIAGWVASDLARRDAVREASVGWGAHGQARGTLDVQEEWILEVAANDPLLAGKAIADMEVALARVLTRSLGQTCESEVLLRLLLARLYLQSGGEELAREHTRRLIESIHGLRGIGPQDRERVLELKQLLLGPELESNT